MERITITRFSFLSLLKVTGAVMVIVSLISSLVKFVYFVGYLPKLENTGVGMQNAVYLVDAHLSAPSIVGFVFQGLFDAIVVLAAWTVVALIIHWPARLILFLSQGINVDLEYGPNPQKLEKVLPIEKEQIKNTIFRKGGGMTRFLGFLCFILLTTLFFTARELDLVDPTNLFQVHPLLAVSWILGLAMFFFGLAMSIQMMNDCRGYASHQYFVIFCALELGSLVYMDRANILPGHFQAVSISNPLFEFAIISAILLGVSALNWSFEHIKQSEHLYYYGEAYAEWEKEPCLTDENGTVRLYD